MRVIEQRLRNLVKILNQNIGKELTVSDWTYLVNEKFPYANVKPPNHGYNHTCADSSHKQVNSTYLCIFELMGYTKRGLTNIEGRKKQRHTFTALKEIRLISHRDI